MSVQVITQDRGAEVKSALGDEIDRSRKRYLQAFLELGPRTLASTAELERVLLVVNGKPVPVVVNHGAEEQCYVLSPYAHYVKYFLLELKKVPGVQSRVLQQSVGLLGRSMLPLGFNRCVSANNWLFTTNPQLQLTTNELHEMTRALVARYPDYPLVVRTVDAREPSVQESYASAGYRLVPNRPVHEWDPTRLQRSHRRQVLYDARTLEDPRFEVERDAQLRPGDAERIFDLYTALYIGKHRGFNCRYTEAFFRLIAESGAMKFTMMRHRGELVAFLTQFDDGERTVAALVGYDTSLDRREFPLYRMCLTSVLMPAFEPKRLVFLSTGASSFKRNRGTYEWMEHEAIYDRHLSLPGRLPWTVFKAVLDAGTKNLDMSTI